MTETATTLAAPDLAAGVPISDIGDGTMLLGHMSGEPVILARRGHELFAFDAFCTHNGAPLGDGLLVDDTAASTIREYLSNSFVVVIVAIASAPPKNSTAA